MEALNTTGSILVCRSHSQLPCLSCLSRLESFCYSPGVLRSKDTVTRVTMSPHRVAVTSTHCHTLSAVTVVTADTEGTLSRDVCGDSCPKWGGIPLSATKVVVRVVAWGAGAFIPQREVHGPWLSV